MVAKARTASVLKSILIATYVDRRMEKSNSVRCGFARSIANVQGSEAEIDGCGRWREIIASLPEGMRYDIVFGDV